jgi:hypothetical protein
VKGTSYNVGDLIGFSGHDWLSAGINLGTYGIPGLSLSHVGIIGEHHGKIVLFESTTLSKLPCLVQGKVVSGAQVHDIADRLDSYRGRAWHYPLYRSLFPHERRALNQFLFAHVGRPYDAIGAFRSAGIGFSLVESMLRRADLGSLFCSEWCAAAHATIGLFPTGNVSRWNPNRLVRAEQRAGILKPRVALSTATSKPTRPFVGRTFVDFPKLYEVSHG